MRHAQQDPEVRPKRISAVVDDTFFAQWDVDGRWYQWIIFKLKDGSLIVNRYLASSRA